MDIFCSTSVRSKTLQNSSKEIRLSLFSSASMIVRSAIDISCSSLILAPTIIVKTANSSSLEIRSLPSKSYMRNATKRGRKKTLSISADTDYRMTHQARNLTNDFKFQFRSKKLLFKIENGLIISNFYHSSQLTPAFSKKKKKSRIFYLSLSFEIVFLNYYLVGTPGRNQNLHLSFSSREFNLFFSAVFLIGLKWAKTLTKSQKLTTSRSDPVPPFSAEMSLIPLAPSWPSRKNAWTILSHNGLMANSGIRRKSSRVK